MKSFIRHFRFSMFAAALLCAALGVALLLWPEASRMLFCYAFGGVLLLSGVFQIAAYLAGRKKSLLHTLMFIGGIVAAVAGVWVLLTPGRVLTLTVIVMGIVLLYHGVMDIKYAHDLRRCNSRSWSAAFICGLFTCGVGVLLLVNPFESMETLFLITAIGFIFDGVSDLFTVFAVADSERRLELAEQKTEAIEAHGEELPLAAPAAGEIPAAEETPAQEVQS